jgi:hypothetical protein
MIEVPEVEVANQEMPFEVEVHVAAPEGLLVCFSYVLLAIVDCCGPDILGMQVSMMTLLLGLIFIK